MSEILNAPKNDGKEGKPRMSVVPLDIIEELLPPAYMEGIEKYLQESWRLGFEYSKIFDALQRHINAFFYKGEDFDPDPRALKYKKHHLAGVIFSALSLYWSWKTRPDLDDRPPKRLEKAKEALRAGTVNTRLGEVVSWPYSCPKCGLQTLIDSAPGVFNSIDCPSCGVLMRPLPANIV